MNIAASALATSIAIEYFGDLGVNAAGTTASSCREDLLEEIVGSSYDEYDVRKNNEPERQDQRTV